MEIKYCLLTGYHLEQPATLEGMYYTYNHPAVGKVKIGFGVVTNFQRNNDYKHPILAGICRNAFESKEEPPIITNDYIIDNIKNVHYPKEFREKARYLLKFIYNEGGKDFIKKSFTSQVDYTICYANEPEEFVRIMDFLINTKYWLTCAKVAGTASGNKFYSAVTLTELGIEEAEKELPKIPMIGLVEQKVNTGDAASDARIEHALRLFMTKPESIENMRSACQALAYELEPLRKSLSSQGFFASKDVNDFFQIVNEFDIRHNKEQTKNIEHPEQLEWVFYTFLNTINSYSKLKQRLG